MNSIMSFEHALTFLKASQKMRRSIWREDIYVELKRHLPHDIPKHKQDVYGFDPYFEITTCKSNTIGWMPCVTDLLANDWERVLED